MIALWLRLRQPGASAFATLHHNGENVVRRAQRWKGTLLALGRGLLRLAAENFHVYHCTTAGWVAPQS